MRGNQPPLSFFLLLTALAVAFPRARTSRGRAAPRVQAQATGKAARPQDSPAAQKPKPAGTGECSASSSRITTSDTLIGQALAGAGPGGLRRGWEASREAERPGRGAPPPPQRGCRRLSSSSSSRNPQSHNHLHFRLPAAVADPRGHACADQRARRLAGVAAA